jgi:hypothetical protein
MAFDRGPDGDARAEVRRDLLLWAAVTAWTGGWAVRRATPSGISWHFFRAGAHLLVHPGMPDGGLHLYAAHPELQIGPIAFLVAAALSWLPNGAALIVGQVLMTAVLPIGLFLWAPLVARPGRRIRIAGAALALAPTWTVLSVRWAHLDDAIACLLLGVAVRCSRDDRAVLTGLAVGLAAGAKPWAVLGLPLVLLLSRRLAGAVVAGAALVAVWGPFLLVDPASTAAFHPAVGISSSSALSLLGYHGAVIPGWDRTAQLTLAPLAAMAAVRAGSWPAALLCGIAVRLALDPQDLAYYAAAAVLAAAAFDLFATRSRLPWITMLTALALWQPFVIDFSHRFDTSTGVPLWWFQHPHHVAGLHLAWAVAVLALPWTARRSAPAASRTQADGLPAGCQVGAGAATGPPGSVEMHADGRAREGP